jgi:iron complex outermembrane receptor protein
MQTPYPQPNGKGVGMRICGRAYVHRNILTAALTLIAFANMARADDQPSDSQQLETIRVTGTHIKRAEIESQQPVITISSKEIADTGLASIGDIRQHLSVASSSLNTKFNSVGDFGFPADGGGVASGST